MARRKFREDKSKFYGTKQVLQDLNAPAHTAVHETDPIVPGLPAGGLTDQVLSKVTSTDFDTYWQSIGVTTNLDGGFATVNYGGTTPVDGGSA